MRRQEDTDTSTLRSRVGVEIVFLRNMMDRKVNERLIAVVALEIVRKADNNCRFERF